MVITFRRTATVSTAILLVAAGGLWWAKAQAPINPTVAAPTLTPGIITVNTPTSVTATVSIPDPTLNPSQVDLLRVNSDGTTAVVAPMVDTGKNGDVKPGDRVFTAVVTLNEPQAKSFGLLVAAIFRGQNRILSPSTPIQVWNATTTTVFQISYPPGWSALTDDGQTTVLTRKISLPTDTSEFPGDVLIFKDANPSGLALEQYYRIFRGGYLFDTPSVVQPFIAARKPGLRFTHLTGMVSGDVVVLPASGYLLRIEDRGGSELFNTILQTIIVK